MKKKGKFRDFFRLVPYGVSYLSGMIFKPKRQGMESRTKNRKNRDQIAKMVEKAFPGSHLAEGEETIIELKEGWFNAAYDVLLDNGEHVILKIAPPKDAEILTYEKDIMDTEVATMRMVAQDPAIPVPEIYTYDTSGEVCDSNYFLMQKLEGQNYDHCKKDFLAATRSEIDRNIGAIVREINQYTGSYFGYDGNRDLQAPTWKDAFIKIVDSVLEDGRKKNADYSFSIEEIREVVQKHAASLDAVVTPQLVHWDAWDLNVFVKDGQITGLLDFERALWADPLMEAQFRALAFGGVTDSLRGYGKTDFTHAEQQRNHLYTLHLALVMKTEGYYRSYDTHEVANLAMMLLIPAMMWLKEN